MSMTLALVIPCYNESNRLAVRTFLEGLRRMPNLSLCFVDDGSTDQTAELLAFLSHESPNIEAVYLNRNVGKAEAVRAGMLFLSQHSGADAFGFWDADLSTPLTEIPAMLTRLETNPWCSAVIGVRWPHLGARICRTAFRGLASRFMKRIIRLYLGVPLIDSQCGAKIFRRELATQLFGAPFVSRWLLDVELFKRMSYLCLRHGIYEQPLESWHEIPGSKLAPFDAWKIGLEFYSILKRYSQTPSESTRGSSPA